MAELWLTYQDPDGSRRRVAVRHDGFVIGRHSECDLAIADSRLSRKHATIKRTGESYLVEDLGSSNGTEVNGAPVFDPVVVCSGDVINFGGLEARAEIEVVPEPVRPEPAAAVASAPAAAAENSSESKDQRGIPLWLIFLAPVTAAVLVVVAAAVVLIFVSRGTDVSANTFDDDPIPINDGPSNSEVDDKPASDNSNTEPTGTTSTNIGGPTPTADNGPTATPANLSETAKVEINGAGFLRRIAQNDPRAFLTTEQAKRVSGKVKQLSGSSAVAANISSARKNAAQLKSLAASKNLKPQLLAVAAIAKLGATRGDVFAAAQSMADVLDKLSIQLGNELADDCLLSIAAFDQGAAGETMKMRNMLQELANKSSESSRTIRSIWFLQKEGKITQAEFDRALVFLAVGTIAQNPKDFGVNTEPLDL